MRNPRTKRAQYQQWLRERRGIRRPVEEAALLQVAAAYDAVQRDGRLTPGRLAILIHGVSNKKALVWCGSSQLLERLSEQFEEAAAAIQELSRRRQGHVRFNALCCLGKRTPSVVVNDVIRSGLADKSSRVRLKAADRALSLRCNQLVPELTAALSVERHAEARSTIEFGLKLLRDGYIIEKASKGGFWVTVTFDDGIPSRFVNEKDLKELGIKGVIARMRKDRA